MVLSYCANSGIHDCKKSVDKFHCLQCHAKTLTSYAVTSEAR